MHASFCSLLWSSLAVGAPRGLHFDPTEPGLVIEEASGDLHWSPRPGVSYRVAGGVVVALEPGASIPGAVPLGGPQWLVPTAPRDALRVAGDLATRPGVRMVFPDVVLHERPQVSFDDPHVADQWYLDELGMEEAWDQATGSPEIRVAVIDSGIDTTHPDLSPQVVAGYDALDDDTDPNPNPGEFCGGGAAICDEHGTAVSGIVLAKGGNGEGIVGICPDCSLVAIKMLGDYGALSADIRAFEFAIEQDAWVINNSWGYNTAVPVPSNLALSIERAATEPRGGKGALVVFAAGNDNRALEEAELYSLPEVLTVSAINSYGQPANYTNFGAAVDVAAPSATVSIAPGGGLTKNFGGTSAAAPVVSGIAAWALALRPDLTAAELQGVLVASTVQSPLITPDADGHHDIYGYGVIDMGLLAANLLGERDSGDTAETEPPAEEPKGGCACASGAGGGGGVWVAAVWIAAVAGARRRTR